MIRAYTVNAILATIPVWMGMSIVISGPPAATLFSIVIVTCDVVTLVVTPSISLICASMPSGRLMPAGRSMAIEPWTDADAGVPHGRTVAPMLKVIAGRVTAGTAGVQVWLPAAPTQASSTLANRGTAGVLMGQVDVPPTPESASTHEQPRPTGRSGVMTVQTGPEEASTRLCVMASTIMSERT